MPPKTYDIPFEASFAASPAAGPGDFSSFLKSATEQLQVLSGKQQERARQEESLKGMGRSGNLSSRLESIDTGTREMLKDLARKVAVEKFQQEYQQRVYREQKEEYQKGLEEQKSKAKEKGLWQLGGTALGGLASLAFPPLGAALGGGLGGVLTGASLGGEVAGGIKGLEYGEAPSFESLNLLGQRAFAPEPFNFDEWLKKQMQGIPGGGAPPFSTTVETEFSVPPTYSSLPGFSYSSARG